MIIVNQNITLRSTCKALKKVSLVRRHDGTAGLVLSFMPAIHPDGIRIVDHHLDGGGAVSGRNILRLGEGHVDHRIVIVGHADVEDRHHRIGADGAGPITVSGPSGEIMVRLSPSATPCFHAMRQPMAMPPDLSKPSSVPRSLALLTDGKVLRSASRMPRTSAPVAWRCDDTITCPST
jgi:hypothetical protein